MSPARNGRHRSALSRWANGGLFLVSVFPAGVGSAGEQDAGSAYHAAGVDVHDRTGGQGLRGVVSRLLGCIMPPDRRASVH